MKIYKFLIIIFLIFLYCEKSNNYEEIETKRNIYIFLNLVDDAKLNDLCISSETSALNCANTSINQNSYILLISNFYSITANNNPNSYCQNLIESQFFKNLKYSKDAIRCHFQCNENFWKTCYGDFNTLLSQYSKCLPAIWIQECTETTLKSCLQSCFLNGDPIWFIN